MVFRSLLLIVAVLASSWRVGAVDFDHDVIPILRQHCVRCHGDREAKGGFSINSRDAFLEDDAAVVGDSSASYFLELLDSVDVDAQMPPQEQPRVSSEHKAILAQWVDEGMPWTDDFTFASDTYQPPLLPRKVALPGRASDGHPGGELDNPIDRLLDKYLSDRGLDQPEHVDDFTFVRRASLDLCGLLPTIEMVENFVSNKSKTKCAELVDKLLSDDLAYAEHWLTFWNDLLRNDYDGTGFITGGRKQISGWLYDSLIHNKPYDQFTRELIAPQQSGSRGFIDGIKWRGTVSAGQTVEIQFAQSVAQSFLGINLKCASCHDSFIDRWKLTEAYSLAAVYAADPLVVFRCDKPTGKVAKAAWLFPELGEVDPGAPRDERLRQLASLMTDRDNGRFSRTIVNRLWAQLMGRGIVHPLDAMHTRPWNEDLLDHLANHLVEQDYDLKAVLRLIATSSAYSSRSEFHRDQQNDSSQYVYSGPRSKRMTAEQFVDSVWQLTGAAPREFDAPVVRGKADAGQSESLPIVGQWIWGDSAKEGKVPPGGEQLVFRKQFDLPAAVNTGVAVVTADNSMEMYIGRRSVTSSKDWSRVQTVPLRGLLKKGKNEIIIVARNFLDTPNLAGMYLEARLVMVDGKTFSLQSDASWQVSKMGPVGGREGRLGKTPGPWNAATTLGFPQVYAKVRSQAKSSLSLGVSVEPAMVRASLLKSDFLMRSLGRPNRDQIVSSRPADLTTLEAIDLANGQTLARSLAIGARRWAARDAKPAEEWIDELFRSALSRPPTEAERSTLVAVVANESNGQANEQAIEDVLWAIITMPEFMMIR